MDVSKLYILFTNNKALSIIFKNDVEYPDIMAILKNVPILRKLIDTSYAILIVVILSALVGLILAFPVMWLWNFVFGNLYKISVFQAWALNVLAGILFGQKNSNK